MTMPSDPISGGNRFDAACLECGHLLSRHELRPSDGWSSSCAGCDCPLARFDFGTQQQPVSEHEPMTPHESEVNERAERVLMSNAEAFRLVQENVDIRAERDTLRAAGEMMAEVIEAAMRGRAHGLMLVGALDRWRALGAGAAGEAGEAKG